MMMSNREETRRRRAAESILEDERLTAALDDDAAKLLLDWGVQAAEKIAAETLDLDDLDAEKASYEQMRALRRSMRYVNKWLAPWPDLEAERTADFLDKFLAQTAVVDPHAHLPETEEQRQAFANKAQTADSAVQLVSYLRQWIEKNQPTEAALPQTKTSIVPEVPHAPDKIDRTPPAALINPLESQKTIEQEQQEQQEPIHEQKKSIWKFWK